MERARVLEHRRSLAKPASCIAGELACARVCLRVRSRASVLRHWDFQEMLKVAVSIPFESSLRGY